MVNDADVAVVVVVGGHKEEKPACGMLSKRIAKIKVGQGHIIHVWIPCATQCLIFSLNNLTHT